MAKNHTDKSRLSDSDADLEEIAEEAGALNVQKGTPEFLATGDGDEETGAAFDDEGEDWSPRSNLDAPKCRPGFEQKWVATSIMGEPRAGHLSYQTTKAGWKPRRYETVPEDERRRFPTSKLPVFGEVIQEGALILCERPKEIGDKRKRFYEKKTQRQMDVVNAQIEEANQGAGRGFGNMHIAENRTRATTRRPIVASD